MNFLVIRSRATFGTALLPKRHNFVAGAPRRAGTTTKRKFSSSTPRKTDSTGSIAASSPNSSSHGSTINPTTTIQRGDKGDSVVCLSVGGKKFYTLQSTINKNSVLASHVASAQANADLTLENAVFVDRDPKYFPYILQHLRDSLDMTNAATHGGAPLTATAASAAAAVGQKGNNKVSSKILWQLPNDAKTLKEIYREAIYYEMNDLQTKINCMKLTGFMSQLFGGNIKPGDIFPTLTALFSQLRVAITTLLGVGSVGAAGKIYSDEKLLLKLKEQSPGWKDIGNNKNKEEKTTAQQQLEKESK